jgi:hypothetical protein
MGNLHRLLSIVGLSAALLLSSAGVASAARWTTTDTTGDVTTATSSTDNNVVDHPTQLVPAPERAAGDLVGEVVKHSRSSVVIRLSMRQVPTGDWIGWTTIRTPRRSLDLFHMQFGGKRWTSLTKTVGNGKELRCAGMSSQVRGTTLRLSIPRRCLGSPRAVQVAAGIAVYDDGMRIAHVDDGLRPGYDASGFWFSPKIRRG